MSQIRRSSEVGGSSPAVSSITGVLLSPAFPSGVAFPHAMMPYSEPRRLPKEELAPSVRGELPLRIRSKQKSAMFFAQMGIPRHCFLSHKRRFLLHAASTKNERFRHSCSENPQCAKRTRERKPLGKSLNKNSDKDRAFRRRPWPGTTQPTTDALSCYGLPLLWESSQLPHHPQLVKIVPALGHLAFRREAEDADPRYCDLLARGGDAPKLASVGSAHRPAGDHLIALCHHILDGRVEVRETLSELAHEPLDVFWPALQHGTVRLMGQIPVEDLVC